MAPNVCTAFVIEVAIRAFCNMGPKRSRSETLISLLPDVQCDVLGVLGTSGKSASVTVVTFKPHGGSIPRKRNGHFQNFNI